MFIFVVKISESLTSVGKEIGKRTPLDSSVGRVN